MKLSKDQIDRLEKNQEKIAGLRGMISGERQRSMMMVIRLSFLILIVRSLSKDSVSIHHDLNGKISQAINQKQDIMDQLNQCKNLLSISMREAEIQSAKMNKGEQMTEQFKKRNEEVEDILKRKVKDLRELKELYQQSENFSKEL